MTKSSQAEKKQTFSNTGRIAIPLAACFPNVQVRGLDISKEMVTFASQHARQKQLAANRLKFQVGDLFSFAHDPKLGTTLFDYVLCHWCFHCIRPWRFALLTCVCLTKPDGQLLWLNEDSQLYRALDNLGTKEDEHLGEAWRNFWNQYHLERAKLEPHARAEHRIGPVLRCHDEVSTFLKHLGWIVDTSRGPLVWKREFSYDWIVNTFLGPRSFTNLQRICETKHTDLIRRLKNKLGRKGMPSGVDNVDIEYSASAVHALAKKPMPTFTQAVSYIQGCTDDLYPEVFDLCAYAVHDPEEGWHPLRGAIASFFAALFRPNSLPQWLPFWNPHNKTTKIDLPRWVWIRLAESSAQDFNKFLRQRLWAYADDPALFGKVLQAYFRTGSSFAHLVYSSKKVWRPVVLHTKQDLQTWEFDVTESLAGGQITIDVPEGFVTGGKAYCPDLPNPNEFNETRWKRDCQKNIQTLFSAEPGEEQETVQVELRKFGRKLDRTLGVTLYEEKPERFVRILQATRLFPGRSFYFFPIRDLSGQLMSSVSFGTDVELTDDQVKFLRQCIDRLLTVPSLCISSPEWSVSP